MAYTVTCEPCFGKLIMKWYLRVDDAGPVAAFTPQVLVALSRELRPFGGPKAAPPACGRMHFK